MDGALTTLLVAAITSGGLATVIVQLLVRRKTSADVSKVDAEAKDILTQATERAVRILNDQLAAAAARIKELEAEIEALRVQVKELQSIVKMRSHERTTDE